ncbi:hypothetical protein CES86_5741 [Brucella lupini]|uniref:Uncharacterized protein n=1 Tax=Brucella lupini TaxID=255457 RepID=A0A256H0R4_9HYPH|nr:hypothetical protein CES86_5741 [Brucella lupini]
MYRSPHFNAKARRLGINVSFVMGVPAPFRNLPANGYMTDGRLAIQSIRC